MAAHNMSTIEELGERARVVPGWREGATFGYRGNDAGRSESVEAERANEYRAEARSLRQDCE